MSNKPLIKIQVKPGTYGPVNNPTPIDTLGDDFLNHLIEELNSKKFQESKEGQEWLESILKARAEDRQENILGAINTYSSSGIEYIKSWEKCILTSYDAHPGTGDWTIGWGHKLYEYSGQPNNPKIKITQETADQWFEADVQKMLDTTFTSFLSFNNVKLTTNQFDAMLSFTFNYGEYSWGSSGMEMMKEFLIKGDFSEQATRDVFQFYIDRTPLDQSGNIQRRKDELEMFLHGTYNYHN